MHSTLHTNPPQTLTRTPNDTNVNTRYFPNGGYTSPHDGGECKLITTSEFVRSLSTSSWGGSSYQNAQYGRH